ncbi:MULTISPECIES: 3-methyl-2-oxobutanoate dehydrogenase subunit VorB [unclassified Fusibacter]|uniref:3-methyl-2-oxobutanoate dehydrogenase subunit VorB n=1 Tax=unclassified Fusibacter TaxID=2624464 RepID=UPI0010132D5B|nr:MULTISPECIES: 3-methyl-2-oxobutanoate dehydrogenase subunit VorB [unclassified Fusibacter]MCK8059487.1 3-methyl-2-oxobutanoate dehydrogenase subunit VorB [Fusibacter sp. A2]NPE21049.1 3-methyl-2-oxobutanoate dehydrogenase subunit VorB [Fusibacter sp. A1]RXV62324.1 3-methyl-2-oxobutanoate dehydrogenase subunit VorB [Fusibacter sp. A1]
MSKVLMKGNEAISEAAIRAGCKAFFGYPITPQNEIPEYMSREMPKNGGVFVQAESEVAAINMVYGAAGCGVRTMTSSSSPGIALKQEGISYIAGAELPCVIVNIVRGGPGLGGIQPAQSDYNQSTRGGGNGDYKLLVYAPGNLQEMVDLVQESFDKADYYRNPVMVVGDGMIGQMMEPIEFRPAPKMDLPAQPWATTGTKGERKPNIINSLFLKPEQLEDHNIRLTAKYATMKENEQRFETFNMEKAEVVCVAYGTTSRIVKNAIVALKEEGIEVGLIRPITLWPFPQKAFAEYPETAKSILCVEMSMGQMIDDIRIVNEGRLPVDFYGRSGGMIPTPEAIEEKLRSMVGGAK